MIPCDDEVMRIVQVHATPLFTGTAAQPEQIVRVTVAGEAQATPIPAPVLVRVEGAGEGVIDSSSTLIEHFDGTSWSVVPSPNAGSTTTCLSGVAGASRAHGRQ